MQWVSIKSGLPQTTKQISWYIVNTSKGVGVTEYNPTTGFSNVVIVDNAQYSGIEITHWMALPPPPGN